MKSFLIEMRHVLLGIGILIILGGAFLPSIAGLEDPSAWTSARSYSVLAFGILVLAAGFAGVRLSRAANH